ncbi:MAG: hypothetical protein ACE5D2_07225 [Fidelibacterota bacterium]
MSESEQYSGILRQGDQGPYLEGPGGECLLSGVTIWEGYLTHWLDQPVHARYLPQRDYESNEPILILWPDEPAEPEPFVELYYNERLVKYPASTFGHIAINVNGEIFNYSHLLNENEILDLAEYLYRPALGEFAPSPTTGTFELRDDGRVYYDKFGRRFMRTIHVLKITGLEVDKLAAYYHRQLEAIHSYPRNPRRPEKFQGFNFLNRSCSTIIRDGLRHYGFNHVSGVLPRDFFISAAHTLFQEQKKQGFRIKLYKLTQLKVPEAPYSKVTPLMNPLNWFKLHQLPELV